MANVQDVAKYLLQLASSSEEAELITNLKLQKLLYYCQGFSLAFFNKPLFDSPVEAWTHGPVCPEIYHAYKTFGSDRIPAPEEFDADTALDDGERDLIDNVYATYGQFAAWRLREMTHEERPWIEAEQSCEITNDSMKEFFKTRIVA